MSGGVTESVMGVIQDGASETRLPMGDGSGFEGKSCYFTIENYETNCYISSGDPFPEDKFYDLYASGMTASGSHLGDALGETAGWYKDRDEYVCGTECLSSASWFGRGGSYDANGANAGVFYFYNVGKSSSNGFRVVLTTIKS